MRAALLVLVAATLPLNWGHSPPVENPRTRAVPVSPVLTGVAVLPADSFAPGPPSGAFIRNGVRAQFPPFEAQPVQGFSAIWPDADGWFWALSDNGFGTKLNSSDYLLRIYRVRPRFGDGRVEVDDEFVQFSDPDRLVPFRIVNEESGGRLLTGSDFDPESMVRMPDGTFWIGDEFGPFLLHISADGRLLAPPVEAPGVRSPDHPLLPPANAGEQSPATVGRSRGFEGLAPYPKAGTLVALLEGGLLADGGTQSRALEFDPATRSFTGRTWIIPFEEEGHAFAELVRLVPETRTLPGGKYELLEPFGDGGFQFLVIERDDGHGPSAKFKRVFVVSLWHDRQNPDGSFQVTKNTGPPPLQNWSFDLLNIEDRRGLAGGGTFRFPYFTTEALWPLWPDVIVVNDNNYPATGGRHPDRRDATEFIRLRMVG